MQSWSISVMGLEDIIGKGKVLIIGTTGGYVPADRARRDDNSAISGEL